MKICVYLSASCDAPRAYFESARALGRRIGSGGHALIYGGGNIGTLGELAEGAKESGAHITSVIPRFFHEDNLTYTASDQLVLTDDLQERRRIMIEQSDAAIALPGGFGTLEELAEFLTLRQLGFHRKPLALVDSDQFWSGFLSLLQRMHTEKMIQDADRDLVLVETSPNAAVERLENVVNSRPADSKRAED